MKFFLNNSIERKLAILLLPPLLFLLILSTLYSLEKNAKLNAAKQQLIAVEIIQDLILPLKYTPQHRGMTNSFLNGETDFKPKILEIREKLNKHYSHLIDKYSQWPAVVMAAKELDSTWKALQARSFDGPPAKIFNEHTQLIEDIISSMLFVSDELGLILSENRETIHAIQIALNSVPEATNQLGILRGYGSGVIASNNYSDERVDRIEALKLRAEVYISQTQRSFDVIEQLAPELAALITNAVSNSVNVSMGFINTSDEIVKNRATSKSPEQFFSEGTTAIESLFELEVLLLNELGLLISRAISEAHTARNTAVIISIVVILFSLVIAFWTGRQIIAGTSRVKDAISEIAEGHYDNTYDSNGKDEISAMMSEIESMRSNLSSKSSELQATVQRLELILEGTRLGMWDWNPQTNEVFFDDRWAEMLGVKSSDLTQTLSDWQDRVHEDDIESCLADITAHMEGKVDFYENTHRMRHADGRWRYILDRGQVVERDNEGKPLRFTGTHTDVTELKLAEQQAKDALDMRNRFFANMSHELRTPLHGILNLAEFGLDESTLEEKNHSLQSILKSTRILSNIVNDILDFSKIEAGKLEIESIKFNLDTLLKSVAQPLTQVANDKGIEFILNVAPNVENNLIGDPVRIIQILNNLCSNGIKFTEHGTVELSVLVVETKEHSQELLFSVSDSGIGISKTAQTKLFSDFHQADASTSRKYGGTGLGLSICTKLSELMSGKISFESELGKGSTFTYQQKFEITELAENASTELRKVNLEKAKVLVAEDVKVNQLIIEKMLEDHNAQVIIVEDGKECVDYYQKHDADIIFMDIQMPVMDGIQATQLIRARESGQSVPIIAMTANAMKEDVNTYMDIGMNDCLSKPFDQEMLNDLLHRFSKRAS